MRGISEESLRKLRDYYHSLGINPVLYIDDLIATQCKELNPWLPITENTPKDRLLLLLTKEHGFVVGKWFQVSDRGWWMANCMPVAPTHYQELPDDPVWV